MQYRVLPAGRRTVRPHRRQVTGRRGRAPLRLPVLCLLVSISAFTVPHHTPSRCGVNPNCKVFLSACFCNARLPRRASARSTASAATATPGKGGRTLAEFRQQYDKSTIVPGRVKAVLKQLGTGGWEYEVQFAKIAQVSLADLSVFRDQFSAHVVQLREGAPRLGE